MTRKVEIYIKPYEGPTYTTDDHDTRINYAGQWVDFRDGRVIVRKDMTMFECEQCGGSIPIGIEKCRCGATYPKLDKEKAFECSPETPCCDRRDEYNGYASGPFSFVCPKNCDCHD